MAVLLPLVYDAVFSRVYDSPRSVVFGMWTSPKHFAQWWGPKDFANTICSIDRHRGTWRTVMRSPEGVDYPLKGLYREIVWNELIVMTYDVSEYPAGWCDLLEHRRGAAPGKPATELNLAVTFEHQDGKTKLAVRVEFPTAADREAHMKMGMDASWNQSLDRLADTVANRNRSNREDFIERTAVRTNIMGVPPALPGWQ